MSLSVVKGIRFVLSHGALPQSPLHRLEWAGYLATFLCTAVSLGLNCSNSHDLIEKILRGLIAILITLPGVM